MKKRKKTPSDYSQFSFRISEDEKKVLNERLESLLKILKEEKSEDQYTPKKNSLILRALNIGLSRIERENKN